MGLCHILSCGDISDSLSITHPSMLLYITHNSYCSFAVKTQVPEPLKQKHDLTVLRSEDQNVCSLLGDIHTVSTCSQSLSRGGDGEETTSHRLEKERTSK